MKNAMIRWWMGPSLVSLWLGVSGCAKNDAPAEDFFAGQGDSSRHILEVQQAVGARNDGMLYPRHFDGAMLSGLGRDKLDLMLKDNSKSLPLVVYLDLQANDSLSRDRREAVASYLREQGLLDNQVFLENGVNPATVAPAATGLASLSKTDSSASDAAGAAGGAAGAASSSNAGTANGNK